MVCTVNTKQHLMDEQKERKEGRKKERKEEGRRKKERKEGRRRNSMESNSTLEYKKTNKSNEKELYFCFLVINH